MTFSTSEPKRILLDYWFGNDCLLGDKAEPYFCLHVFECSVPSHRCVLKGWLRDICSMCANPAATRYSAPEQNAERFIRRTAWRSKRKGEICLHIHSNALNVTNRADTRLWPAPMYIWVAAVEPGWMSDCCGMFMLNPIPPYTTERLKTRVQPGTDGFV